MNPFLPLDEYVPDGEPHVFGDRVYLFGSHDREDGETYCELDYVFYSAPVNDLSNWTKRGVSYRATQDPQYSSARPFLYAPDVVQGNDDRFYLYYGMAGKDPRSGWSGLLGVAVADEPDGTYEFLGHVRNPDGSPLTDFIRFDPAVINDDGTIRLYYGFCLPLENGPKLLAPLIRRAQAHLFTTTAKTVKDTGGSVQGAVTVELDDDMLTVRGRPRRIIPSRSTGTSFDGHGFFEASSIRRIDGTYYFIYSSANAHELCYATSSFPDREFTFRGTIVSNGDIGIDGRKPRDRTNQTGNNHGSIERIRDRWYVFYHRHTHNSSWSRQACAEEIQILPDGSIPQVPLTSSGLAGTALPAHGEYPAVICSALTNGKMPQGRSKKRPTPQITHDSDARFIGNVTSDTRIAFRSFRFDAPVTVTIAYRGNARGRIALASGDAPIASLPITVSSSWATTTSTTVTLTGEHVLKLTFAIDAPIEILSITFNDTAERAFTAAEALT